MFILLIAHFVASALEGQNSFARTFWTLLLLVAILIYTFAGTHGGYVVMQKLTAVVAIIWFSLIGVNVSTTVVRVVSARRQMIEWEAEKYMAVLQQGWMLQIRKPDRNRDP